MIVTKTLDELEKTAREEAHFILTLCIVGLKFEEKKLIVPLIYYKAMINLSSFWK